MSVPPCYRTAVLEPAYLNLGMNDADGGLLSVTPCYKQIAVSARHRPTPPGIRLSWRLLSVVPFNIYMIGYAGLLRTDYTDCLGLRALMAMPGTRCVDWLSIQTN